MRDKVSYATGNVARNRPISGFADNLLRQTGLPTIRFRRREDVAAQLSSFNASIDNVFFKSSDQLAYALWGDTMHSALGRYGNMYNVHLEALQSVKLYRAIPENAPAPIALLETMDGRFVGYIREYVNGVNPFAQNIDAFRRMVKELSSVVARLHGNGIGHGDLKDNVIATTNPVKIKLIDPFKMPYESERELIEHDKKQLDAMLRIANSEFA